MIDGELTYEIIQSKGQDAIKCLICDMVSYNENDIREKYCGNCNQFHNIMMYQREMEKEHE